MFDLKKRLKRVLKGKDKKQLLARHAELGTQMKDKLKELAATERQQVRTAQQMALHEQSKAADHDKLYRSYLLDKDWWVPDQGPGPGFVDPNDEKKVSKAEWQRMLAKAAQERKEIERVDQEIREKYADILAWREKQQKLAKTHAQLTAKVAQLQDEIEQAHAERERISLKLFQEFAIQAQQQ